MQTKLTETKLATNLDTDFLKAAAIISMLIDHIGGALFPGVLWMRAVGRLAFPIFCYCMTVGLLYTHDIRRYVLRLAAFAVISQPFYILAFHPSDFWAQITNWNIFFTLLLSLLAMYGFREKKWWLFVVALLVVSLWNFDYSMNGIVLMLIFYCCRNRPKLGAALFAVFYLTGLLSGTDPGSPFALTVGGCSFGVEVLAVLALPLIFIRTKTGVHIPKWFFYAFYPAHLALIAAIRLVSGI